MQIKMNQPASRWAEALPLGNGHFGAMVYGGIDHEQIDLSAATFFSGRASAAENCPEDGWQAFAALRQAALAGDLEQMQTLTRAFMGRQLDYGTNLAVGQLLIDRPLQTGTVQAYARSLDLLTGCCAVRWTTGPAVGSDPSGADFLASHADRALFGRLLPDPDGRISARLSLRGECLQTVEAHADLPLTGTRYPAGLAGATRTMLACHEIVAQAQALETLHSNGQWGVRAALVLHIWTTGGQAECQDGMIWLNQVTDCLLAMTLETDFDQADPLQMARQRQDDLIRAAFSAATADNPADGPNRSPASGSAGNRAGSAGEDWLSQCWQIWQQQHLADFEPLMKRVRLQLGSCDPEQWILPADRTPAELADSADLDEPLAMTALLFQYGRYLLIASSRADSPVPAPLQGIWNDQVASRIGWTCDMHLDINTQMNYWPAEITALPECVQPLFHWMRERLVPAGRITAARCYNLPGWVAELVSNAWGFAAPYWSPSLSPCPTGGAWLLNHVWQHYRHQPDLAELAGWIMPMLAEAVAFYSSYLFEQPDSVWLQSGPSISPENAYIVHGQVYHASLSCTYEITIIRDVFSCFDQACQILAAAGLLPDAERALQGQIKSQLERLPPFRVAEDGSLCEWRHDYPPTDPQHRHTSHLLALFPFGQITPETTPELAQAAAVTLRHKLDPPESWEDTGWARSMLMLYSSRLHDGDAAWRHIQAMYRFLTQPNLLVRHPPTRGAPAFADVFELDGNTGLTTCIADLLLQYHQGRLDLLPALPAAWPTGSVQGLRAWNRLQVDLAWQGGHLTEARFYSPCAQTFIARYRGQDQNIVLAAEVACHLLFPGPDSHA